MLAFIKITHLILSDTWYFTTKKALSLLPPENRENLRFSLSTEMQNISRS